MCWACHVPNELRKALADLRGDSEWGSYYNSFMSDLWVSLDSGSNLRMAYNEDRRTVGLAIYADNKWIRLDDPIALFPSDELKTKIMLIT